MKKRIERKINVVCFKILMIKAVKKTHIISKEKGNEIETKLNKRLMYLTEAYRKSTI